MLNGEFVGGKKLIDSWFNKRVMLTNVPGGIGSSPALCVRPSLLFLIKWLVINKRKKKSIMQRREKEMSEWVR
jgi:hypothetical protein